MIRIDYLGKSSQMPTASSIQFVSPELSQSPGATVVQQDWTDVCIVEPHFKGKVHFECSPHALHPFIESCARLILAWTSTAESRHDPMVFVGLQASSP